MRKGDPNLGNTIRQRCQDYKDYMDNSGVNDIMRISYAMYYNAINDNPIWNRFGISNNRKNYIYSPANVYKNIGKNFLNIIYSKSPTQRARAQNTDPRVSDKIDIYNSLLEYDYNKKGLDKLGYNSGETSWIFGTSFMFVEWDFYKGKDMNIDDEDGQRVFSGDWTCDVYSPFDVYIDPTKKKWEDVESFIIRQKVNKFVLASKYPQFDSEIIHCDNRDWVDTDTFTLDYESFSEDIFIYKYVHKPMPGFRNEDYDLEDGRYITVLSDGTVIEDEPNWYGQLNIFPLSFNKRLYSVYGDSDAFDLLPLQKLLNVSMSCVATKVTAFGIDKIVIPNTGTVAIEDLASGLKAIKMPPNQPAPTLLNLMGDIQQHLALMPFVEKMMEGISAMSSVVRGDPGSIKAGVSLSIIEQKAIQYTNNAQKNGFQQLNDVSNFILTLRKKYSRYGDLVPIVGEDKKFKLERFTQEDFNSLESVILEPVDSISNSIATKEMTADKLSGMGITPEEYVTFKKTGRLERQLDDTFEELNAIQFENVAIKDGNVPMVVRSDNDDLHIAKHRAATQDIDARTNPRILWAYDQHIKMHEDNKVTKAQHQATIQNILQTVMAPPLPQQAGQGMLPPAGEQPLPEDKGLRAKQQPMQ